MLLEQVLDQSAFDFFDGTCLKNISLKKNQIVLTVETNKSYCQNLSQFYYSQNFFAWEKYTEKILATYLCNILSKSVWKFRVITEYERNWFFFTQLIHSGF